MDRTNLSFGLIAHGQGRSQVPSRTRRMSPKARPLFRDGFQARFRTAPSGTRPVSR